MKKLFIPTILFSGLAFGQIKEQKNNLKCTTVGEFGHGAPLQQMKKCPGNTYMFVYLDDQYRRLNEFKSFAFKDVDGAFDNLYNTLIRVLEEEPIEPVILDLPNDKLHINFSKLGGKSYVSITQLVNKSSSRRGYTGNMNRERIDLLFGKTKSDDDGR